MSFTRKTLSEARELANELRIIYADEEWEVKIFPPCFPGDFYHIVVG
jgi:hypothetical protein